jgi:hypothetical protein
MFGSGKNVIVQSNKQQNLRDYDNNKLIRYRNHENDKLIIRYNKVSEIEDNEIKPFLYHLSIS